MFTPLLLMLSGIVLGYLGRRAARQWQWPAVCLRLCAHVIPPAVLFLLFMLGASVGGDSELLRVLPRLGGVALWLTLCGLIGSFCCVRLIRRYLPRVPDSPAEAGMIPEEPVRESPSRRLLALATGSAGILSFFCLGLVLAWAALLPPVLTSHTSALYALYFLMTLVGISLGKDERMCDILRTLRPRTLLLPLATGVGTLLGSALAWLAVDYSLTECLAVGSGFVYYSLSSVIITMSYPKKYSVKKSIALDILSDILTMRYLKSIREDQGGTYGVGVGGNAILEPYARYNMTINFDCDPDKANILKPIIYQEIDNIVENGVTTEELDKVVKNMLKESAQEKQHNSYWFEQLEAYYRTGINFDAPENHEKILEEMTTKDIKKFAAEFFKHANVVDLMFVPSGKTVEN